MAEGRDERSARILVVETDRMSQSAVSLLRDTFDRVSRVPDGAGAVQAFVQESPDLVILNLGYFVMERVRYWNELRYLDDNQRKLLLVLSDSRAPADEIVALDLGADDYMSKPVTGRRLARRVRTILRLPRRTSLT